MVGNWSAYRTRLTTVDGQNLFLIRGVRRVETGDDVPDVPRAEAPRTSRTDHLYNPDHRARTCLSLTSAA